MTEISAREAFDAYEAVRHRLPETTPSEVSLRKAATLEEIADEFDVFLLDAFGVLNIGDTAIPGTPERVRSLKAAGKRVLVVSNAASVPHEALLEKYARLGYDFAPQDVITSRATLLGELNGQSKLHWGLMATPGDGLRDLEGLQVSYLEDDPKPYETVDGFLMIGSAVWTETRQAMLETALLKRPRPVMVGNPDIVAPREYGFSKEPGLFAHRLADRTGIAPQFFGKPFGNIYDLAFRRLGHTDKSRVLMVGDSLHTDIVGARNAGIVSALISGFGFFAGHDVEAAIKKAKIVPDFVVNRP
ncbi:HAD family hydrolase (plasmid) [Ruegeria sp. AD91A]|uniref:HAD-IIA family hydrolase n=1 Tax=uncultured Ruegeria sp. TaxID=259304 RepID=UPI000E49E684|nr:HAD-IA family hydrolase [Ruegeria sp. AD91A]AXT29292.1 HAD family hydrolase [Ruegeria sp. AD91A]